MRRRTGIPAVGESVLTFERGDGEACRGGCRLSPVAKSAVGSIDAIASGVVRDLSRSVRDIDTCCDDDECGCACVCAD